MQINQDLRSRFPKQPCMHFNWRALHLAAVKQLEGDEDRGGPLPGMERRVNTRVNVTDFTDKGSASILRVHSTAGINLFPISELHLK